MKELPIYDITIEDDAEIQGVSKISLVDVPAIGVNWIALRKAELNLQDVFGYETQHFDICPGAQKTFENYSKMQLDEDTIGMIRSAAQNADNVFEIEKRVVAEGRATSQDLEQVKTLVADFKDIIAEIDKITNQPQNVDYMDGHIKVVQDLLPKTMMAVRKKKSKMSFAKKECLGCPPNGDGTRVNGEPDKRCKGDGAEKTPKAGGGKATAKPSTSPKNTATPEQSISKISQIGSTMGQVIDDKKILDNAKKSGFLVYEDVSAANKTINLSPPSGEYRVKIVYNPDGNIGAAKGKPYLAIEDTYRGGEQAQREHWNSKPVQDGLKELFKMKKQNFAKRECLGCPPNGDGTRVNGEPDKRCKGDGADKAGGVKTPKVSTKVSESASNDLQNPKTSEDFTGPKAVEQANNSYVDAIINETTNALTQEYFPDWMKNKQSPPDGPDRRRDYHTAAMRYLGIENDKTWDYDKGKPTKSEPGQKRKVTDLGGYKEIQWSFSKKQTFAKKECLGCPPNGDGTRVNGEPDRRCKGDGTGKTPKGGGGKARGSKTRGGTKSPEESIKSKISNMEPKYPEYVGVNKAGDYVKTTMTAEEGALVGNALNNLREKETEKTKSSNGRTVVERVPYRMTGGVVENDGTRFINITRDWSYVSTDGIPSRSYGNGGRYFSGDDIGSVLIRPDGTRDYSFKNADEADKFFTKLGLK
jgi:hypothetical protein